MAHRGVDWPVQAIGWPTRSAKTVDGRRPLANRAAAVVQHNARARLEKVPLWAPAFETKVQAQPHPSVSTYLT